MTQAHLTLLVSIALATGAQRSAAQSDSSALACASHESGVRISAGAGTTSRNVVALDTTVVLDIADRTWTRDSLNAGLAFGAAGTTGAQSAPWRICTGASASLGRVTASLQGVHGLIHLRIDPSALRALVNPTAAPTRK